MTFKFPIINKLSDILPYIENSPDISIRDKGDYYVVCYNVVTPEMFSLPLSVEGLIRRECRGLIFAKSEDNEILSRPLHKFFNVSEKEYTQIQNLDFIGHKIYNKIDGSMIHGFHLKGKYHLATKGGVTDVSSRAEVWMKTVSENSWKYNRILKYAHKMGLTSIFEWTSPEDRIVVNYGESPDLKLIAVRDMVSGIYYDLKTFLLSVDDLASFRGMYVEDITYGDVQSFISSVSGMRNIEGYVIALSNQDRVKVKTDEYVALHKAKEGIQKKRHIFGYIMDGTIDDIIPKLAKDDIIKVEEIQKEFFDLRTVKVAQLQLILDKVLKTGMSKKEYALSQGDKLTKTFILKAMDGNRSLESIVDNFILKNINRDVVFDNFYENWFSK